MAWAVDSRPTTLPRSRTSGADLPLINTGSGRSSSGSWRVAPSSIVVSPDEPPGDVRPCPPSGARRDDGPDEPPNPAPGPGRGPRAPLAGEPPGGRRRGREVGPAAGPD